MIQRIQSIYLFLTTICFSLILFFPLATIDAKYQFSVWSFSEIDKGVIAPTYYLGLLAVIIAVISLVTIFLYHKRMLQNKLCVALFILILIFLALMFFIYPEFVIAKTIGENAVLNFSIISFFSVLPMIFVLLANRGILKDERKVRAADRLR
jgi:hypothetical protein